MLLLSLACARRGRLVASAALFAALQRTVDLRLLAKCVTAWRDCARLKLISLPAHLHALAGSWGAGANYWRLVELREAERHLTAVAGVG